MLLSRLRRHATLPCIALLGLLFVGCDHSEPTSPSRAVDRTQPATTSSPQAIALEEPPMIGRSHVVLRAAGSFKPNTPVTLIATVLGTRGSSLTTTEINALDTDTLRGSSTGSKRVAAWIGSVHAGANTNVATETMTFSRPGYYRVLALTHATPVPGETDVAGDSVSSTTRSPSFTFLLTNEAGTPPTFRILRLATRFVRRYLAGTDRLFRLDLPCARPASPAAIRLAARRDR